MNAMTISKRFLILDGLLIDSDILARKITCVWQSLFETFSAGSLPRSHTATACNAVSAFIDAAVVSANDETRQIVLSERTWMAVFDVYLNQLKDAKPKPIKQVLGSLIKALARHTKDNEAQRIRLGVANTTAPSIMLGKPRSRLKASLISVELLIQKGAISIHELIHIFYDWLQRHHKLWEPLLAKYFDSLSLNIIQSMNTATYFNDLDPKTKFDVLKILNLSLLLHATNAELAPSAGSLLALICRKFEQEFGSNIAPETSASIWVAPARHIMLEHLNCLETMSNYILSPLFSVNVDGFHSFTHQLPIHSLLSGDMNDDVPLHEFTLLFSALQVSKKLGLVHEDGESRLELQNSSLLNFVSGLILE